MVHCCVLLSKVKKVSMVAKRRLLALISETDAEKSVGQRGEVTAKFVANE